MKKTITVLLTILLVFIQIGPLLVSANSSIQNERIEGIRIDTNLKNNPNVNLVNLDLLTSRLYTIIDNDLNYYFCLDESKYYPNGTFDYELDPNHVYTGDIIWLLNNFYAHQELGNSTIESFKNESFETQYAATQLAIWSITNPKTYEDGPPKSVLDTNPIILDLIEMAKQHANDTSPSYEALLEQLEQTYIHVSDLERKGDAGDFYTFQSKITHNLTNEFTITNVQTKLEISSNTAANIDITNQSKIDVNIQNETIDVQIPKKIIDEAINTDNELLLTANATIESKAKYYLKYTPVGASMYQPLATRNTLQKNVVDFATISAKDLTSISVYKEWEDNNNQDGKRPAEIQVQLLANDQEYGPVKVLNQENNWAYSWNGLSINDSNGTPIKYTVKEITQIPGYDSTTTNVNGELYKITNKYTPEIINIQGEKTWEDGNNQDGIRPSEIEVKLFANNKYLTSTFATETSDWKYEFTNLPKFDNGEEIKYTVTETPIPNYTSEVNGYDITNRYTPGKTNVKVTKNWDDANNQDGIRPADITVQLLANGEPKGEKVILNDANNWTNNWTDLDEKADGKTIIYSVKELTALDDYDVTINDDNPEDIMITNSYTPKLIDLNGKKIWDDKNNQDGIRPDKVVVNLLANGEKIDSTEATAANQWSYEFTKLPKNKDGKEIKYTVTEDSVPGYNTSIDGTTITNHYTPEFIDLNGEKVWDDKNNQDGIRPDKVVVNLLANGEKIDSTEVSADSQWRYKFTELPKYADGVEIQYTVTENTVPNYSTSIDGTTITNHYTPGKTSVTVTKSWDDANNQDGIRPNEINVQLYANGEPEGKEVVLNEANQWTNTWDDLDEKANGKTITYSVKEITDLGDYDVNINDDNQGNIIITNRYTPEFIDLNGEKVWDDKNNQDGIRPDKVVVNLLANGEKIDSTEVSADSQWRYKFTELPKYADGVEIQYTVTENTVPNYSTSIDGTTITNHYTPELIDLNGEKVWDDKNNQDGIRPDKVVVNLLANGEKIDSTEVSADSQWRYKFTELPKYADGVEIQYTVTENTVPNYSTSIDGTTITNHYTPGKTSVTVTKNWDDVNNEDGIRPNEISVQLYANGKPTGEKVTLNEANQWTTTWDDLDEKVDEKIITYSVKEVDVPDGYTVSIDDTNKGNIILKNTHKPSKGTVKPTMPGGGTSPTKTENTYKPTILDGESLPIINGNTSKSATPNKKSASISPIINRNISKSTTLNEKSASTLPQTGEKSNLFYTLIGVMLIILSSYSLRKKLKMTNK